MSHPSNIKKFEYLSVFILNALYDEFPAEVPDERKLKNLPKSIFGRIIDSDGFNSSEKIYFQEVLSWLTAEDFIRITGGDISNYYSHKRYTLTSKGLKSVGYQVLDSDDKEKVIDAMKKIISKGLEKSSADLIGKVVGKIIGI